MSSWIILNLIGETHRHWQCCAKRAWPLEVRTRVVNVSASRIEVYHLMTRIEKLKVKPRKGQNSSQIPFIWFIYRVFSV